MFENSNRVNSRPEKRKKAIAKENLTGWQQAGSYHGAGTALEEMSKEALDEPGYL
jgi:hypothetical protein